MSYSTIIPYNLTQRDVDAEQQSYSLTDRLLLCSGPPFRPSLDAEWAERVRSYSGKVVVCGGTTAQILARELDREVVVHLTHTPSTLPPTARMEGTVLVTEGILTLTRVVELLETWGEEGATRGVDTDWRVAELLMAHPHIDCLVGTCINPLHHDPSLPIALGVRTQLFERLERVLREKFNKQVEATYY